MSFQWSDPEPHYRHLYAGDSLSKSDRQVILWGVSMTPIAYCDDSAQAERVKQRIIAFMAEVEAEENARFTNG